MNKLNPQLVDASQYSEILTCPNCYQKALIVSQLTCLYCGHTGPADDLAVQFAEDVMGESLHYYAMNGGEFPVVDCFNCHNINTMVIMKERVVCFNCGTRISKDKTSHCSVCDELMRKSEEGDSVCEACWGSIMHEKD